MMNNFVTTNGLVDYLTAHDGGHSGLREGCELVMGLLGVYDEILKERSTLSEKYKAYLTARNQIQTTITQQKEN